MVGSNMNFTVALPTALTPLQTVFCVVRAVNRAGGSSIGYSNGITLGTYHVVGGGAAPATGLWLRGMVGVFAASFFEAHLRG